YIKAERSSRDDATKFRNYANLIARKASRSVAKNPASARVLLHKARMLEQNYPTLTLQSCSICTINSRDYPLPAGTFLQE
ncbi:hypothetical protein M3212_21750, partial [Alkalihalobacillus oceani]|uniref:hypothetical protein n=1 Tax=Halalkalibacter oceani TaxID=1653776 RepID=UPI00203F2E8A